MGTHVIAKIKFCESTGVSIKFCLVMSVVKTSLLYIVFTCLCVCPRKHIFNINGGKRHFPMHGNTAVASRAPEDALTS